MADVLDVAAAVVASVGANEVDDKLTAMKLQKLVYYSQVWHLVDFGAPLFDDPIEAWGDGPVVRRLWEKHQGARTVMGHRFGDADSVNDDGRRIVGEVVERYGRLSAERLSELTHSEPPWQAARGDLSPSARSDALIDLDVIMQSYHRGKIRPEEAVELAVANNLLEGIITDPNALPVLLDVARGDTSVEDAIEERLAAVTG
jgi:uncharacterized phage-associated protein